MQAILVKMVFNLVIKAINKKYNMKSIDSYVHKDNNLDKKVKKLTKEVKELKKWQTPVTLRCNGCKCTK